MFRFNLFLRDSYILLCSTGIAKIQGKKKKKTVLGKEYNTKSILLQ